MISMRGGLVALVVARLQESEGLGFGIASESIHDFLAGSGDTYHAEAGRLEQSLALTGDQKTVELFSAAYQALKDAEWYRGASAVERGEVLYIARRRLQCYELSRAGAAGSEQGLAWWTEEDMADFVEAVWLYRQYYAIPAYRGVSDEDVKAAQDAARVVLQYRKALPPDEKNATEHAKYLAAKAHPELRRGIDLMERVNERRNPARQQFWYQHRDLLEKYFGAGLQCD